jgi:glucokinase
LCDRYAEMTGERRSASGDTFARVRRIIQAVADGDVAARESLTETALCLGVGISNVVWGLDIDTVVIDGALTGAWQLIEPVIREQLPDGDSLAGLNALLRPSALGGDAALIGAATMPFAPVFATGGSLEFEEASA